MNKAHLLVDCLPIQLYRQPDLISWLNTGHITYTDPFFDDTILKFKSLAQNRHHFKSICSPSMLPVWASNINSIEPSAIIFHVSRCGSTLLTQLLGLDEQNIVLSEVPFFDDLLRNRFKENGIDYSHLLPDAVRFYGQKRFGNEQQLFIKTDSWHLFFYEEWRRLYPNTPFILLYRSPNEIIQSQMRKRGLHAIPGVLEKEIFNRGILPNVVGEHEVYISSVLEQYYTKMIEIAKLDETAFLFNYKQGIANIAVEIMEVVGINPSAIPIQAFKERMQYDAKSPQTLFSELALNESVDAYMTKASGLYNQLEQVRVSSIQKTTLQQNIFNS